VADNDITITITTVAAAAEATAAAVQSPLVVTALSSGWMDCTTD